MAKLPCQLRLRKPSAPCVEVTAPNLSVPAREAWTKMIGQAFSFGPAQTNRLASIAVPGCSSATADVDATGITAMRSLIRGQRTLYNAADGYSETYGVDRGQSSWALLHR